MPRRAMALARGSSPLRRCHSRVSSRLQWLFPVEEAGVAAVGVAIVSRAWLRSADEVLLLILHPLSLLYPLSLLRPFSLLRPLDQVLLVERRYVPICQDLRYLLGHPRAADEMMCGGDGAAYHIEGCQIAMYNVDSGP